MADPSEHSSRTARVTRDSFRQELKDARHQSKASQKILAALGRAVANPGDVLDTVLEEAARLCEAQVAQLYLLEGDVFRLSQVSGEIPEEYRKYLQDHPVAQKPFVRRRARGRGHAYPSDTRRAQRRGIRAHGPPAASRLQNHARHADDPAGRARWRAVHVADRRQALRRP